MFDIDDIYEWIRDHDVGIKMISWGIIHSLMITGIITLSALTQKLLG